VDGYTLILAGLLLAAGMMGDRFGRRRFLGIGMVIFGAASAGAALATSSETLILFRGIQGAGAALVLPATLSIITDVFPRAERSKAIGVWTGVGALGLGLGPVLGGVLVDEIAWSAVFWLHLPIVALALFGLRLVPESRDSRCLGLDIRGAILATGGLLAVVFAIIQSSDAGWAAPEIVGAFGIGVALLATFALVELRARTPMLPFHFFRRRDFTGAVLIIGLVFFAVTVTFFFLSQYFQLVQGRSAFTAGIFTLPMAGMMLVGAPISGVLTKSVGPKVLVSVAGLVAAFGMVWLTQLDVNSGYGTIVIGLMAFGFGGGMALAPLTDTVMAAVPLDDAGIGSAMNDVSRELGASLGIAITGSIVSGIYRSNVEDSLTGAVSDSVVESVGQGIGVSAVAAQALPADLAAVVTDAANLAFVDAFTTGLFVSAGFMMVATLASILLIPWRMRTRQVEHDDIIVPATTDETGVVAKPSEAEAA
jgi:EmrB/QacA subfamily drug resistance transporter